MSAGAAVSLSPTAGADADHRMIARRDSMAADERAKDVSKISYDENVGKLNKFYRQGTSCSMTNDGRGRAFEFPPSCCILCTIGVIVHAAQWQNFLP